MGHNTQILCVCDEKLGLVMLFNCRKSHDWSSILNPILARCVIKRFAVRNTVQMGIDGLNRNYRVPAPREGGADRAF